MLAAEDADSSDNFAVFHSPTLRSNRHLRLRGRQYPLERVLQRTYLDKLDRDEHRSQRVLWLQWVALRDHGVQRREHFHQRIRVLHESHQRDSGHVAGVDGRLHL